MLSTGNQQSRATGFVRAGIASLILCVGADLASAVGLVYIDADDGFVTGVPNLSPLSAIDSNISARDNKWGYRNLGVVASIFESSN
jgi:hypothetical protein